MRVSGTAFALVEPIALRVPPNRKYTPVNLRKNANDFIGN